MTTLREGDIEIGLPSGAQGRKFDDNAVHGLSHAGMKAVDFIIEEDDRILFVEIKDPDDPSADEGSRSRFVAQVRRGELDLDLARKYRDSFLYEWAAERVDKPVHYYVLIAHSGLDTSMLLARTEALKRNLPVGVPRGIWTREIARKAMVFNMDSWDTHLSDFPVSRITQGAD